MLRRNLSERLVAPEGRSGEEDASELMAEMVELATEVAATA
jgi:hypothetical protein